MKFNTQRQHMVVKVNEEFRNFYEQGHLDFALHTYQEQGSLDNWEEYLLTQPVASFTNDTEWRYDPMTQEVIWEDGESDPEIYNVSLVIERDVDNAKEVVFHCANGSQSMFYKLLPDYRLKALYVD